MIIRLLITVFWALCIVPSIFAYKNTNCVRKCGAKHLPFPFGFSSACPIRLNCTADGAAVIHEFPVKTVNTDGILINIPAKCDRPIQTFLHLFGNNYAPTSRNGVLLQNCSSQITDCLIPTTMVGTHFESLDCGVKKDTISCYSEKNTETEFIDYLNVMGTECEKFFSAISVESPGNGSAVSLDVQAVKLGWWLEGNCRCSENANCENVLPPITGRRGHRCRCWEGFEGDGYRAGMGCRRASSTCHPQKYISGRCGGTTRVGVLVGGIAAGACLFISIGLLCCFIRKCSRSKNKKRVNRRFSEATGISIPIYTNKEMEKATNFFSDNHRLGMGAYGTVYVGKLENELVAIKRIKHRDNDTIEQVVNEIHILSSVSHPNLVRLLGCSIEKDEQILVYEFMPNGTLSQHLQRERSNGLTWPVRLTIALEMAQAIAYLHSTMDPPIYHRDIKSSNILLDHNFKSKVADFGLSRLGMSESSHISTAPQGTPGYVDPQYHQNFHLSDKSDVYSFGVVLVEIITGLKAVDFSRPQNVVALAALFMDRIGKQRLDEIIDPLIEQEMDTWTISSVHKLGELAFRCLSYDSDLRPSMVEVCFELEKNRLSKWTLFEENIAALSMGSSRPSPSSNLSEKSQSLMDLNPELDPSMNLMDGMKYLSPVSVQDPWLSERSSPSSNCMLANNIVKCSFQNNSD